MNHNRQVWIVSGSCVSLLIAVTMCLVVRANDRGDLRKRASWSSPTREQVQQQIEAWLEQSSADAATRQRVLAVWARPEQLPATEMLDHVLAVIAAADPRTAELIAGMPSRAATDLAATAWLRDEQTLPFVRCNVRLGIGKWLSQQGHIDESLEALGGLLPEQVVDPAALLFHQSVAYHRLLKKEECLTTLSKLLENETLLPRRYLTVARLMEADIRPLETDSLDEIARLMSDIRRRLGFGHAGKRVRQQEDDVIAKLDKKIKEIEEKMQKQASSGEGKGNLQPNNPAPDSQNLGGKGPGDVDMKRLGTQAEWGNLPPKEREQALQQISKDLPAHYREAIEEYFRKLAREGEER